jgi:tripartite-type tricarboxylate transporter receptor subunit TctC
MPGRHPLAAAFSLLLFAFLALPADAQDAWPEPGHPIQLIVPAPGGSGTGDTIARVLAEEMQTRLKGNFVIDNKAGANGNIGATAAAATLGDGYHFLFSWAGTLAVNKALYKNLSFDAQKDFIPIVLVADVPNILVVNNDLPTKDLAEFVGYAKANPGKLNFGFGLGTLPQILGESFKAVTGTDIVSVPYKGGAQAITDMLGGRIQMNFGTTATLLPLIEQGKVRVLAVTTRARSKDLPDVPTMIESGLPQLALTFSAGLLAPAGTPADIIQKLNLETNEAMKTPELTASMAKLGFEPQIWSPQDYAGFLAEEMRRWPSIVKAAGLKPE